ILDDLQSADTPSLLLLEFLAAELGRSRLLILGTHREGLAATEPLARTLSELDRGRLADTIPLRGLAEGDVARFMEVATGTKPSGPLLAAVHRQTEGNPLFVREVVRLLASEGRLKTGDQGATWDFDIPVTIRDAIGRRLELLSAPCNEVLSVASAIGREFSMAILQPVAGLAPNRLSAALE